MTKTLLTTIILLFTASCTALQPPPALDWDHDPDALIVRVTQGGGMQPEAAYYNEIPKASVWGDGRIIWQTLDGDSVRHIWEGQLSEAEMADLLQTFADEGFFRMDDHYSPKEEVYDSSSTSLTLNLLADSYRVGEYHDGAPSGFDKLVGLLGSGAGADGTPYIPQRGYLTAMWLTPRDGVDTTAIPIWDAAALGLDLDDAYGVWVEGDALIRALELVNRKYWSPTVMQGEDLYELYVQLPELTGKEPR